MKFEIFVTLKKEVLDPQGKAVGGTMKSMDLPEIVGVRIGKHVTLEIDAADKAIAEAKVVEACEKLLVNQIMEGFTFRVEESK